MIEAVGLDNYWTVECLDRHGRRKWRVDYTNLIPTAGLNKLLDATFVSGLSSPLWYVGLSGATTTPALADTMSSHAGWTEVTAYSAAARQQWIAGSVSGGSVDNSASKASFTITGSDTVGGAFLVDSSTKGGTTGTLYGIGAFSDQNVVATDVINVTVTLTAGTGGTGFMPVKEEVFGSYHP